MEQQDQINQVAWNHPAAVHWLARLEGFTDEGERAAYWRVVDDMRDKPILDLGVGGGRTVALLRCLSKEYVGVDYLPVMIDAARRRFPFVDLRVGDARDLSQFPDASVSSVVFSYMGIDAVDHEGRACILREVRRVLRPDGLFWFSTLNLTGRAARKRPWQPNLPPGLIRKALVAPRIVRQVPRDTFNYFRVGRERRAGPGWCVAPFFAHSYGLLTHYTTLEHQLAELERAGFRSDFQVFEDLAGREVKVGDDLTDVFCFNIIART